MGKKGREKIYKEAKGIADASLLESKELQAKAQVDVDASRAAYESFEFKNPYANMENTYEDMTVNQQQAQFQAQQGNQQRADIMQNLRGAAGGSGIAGLAQAMANQGQLQTQQISASIGQQESQQQQLKARGAAAVQQMEREGEAMVQQAESGRISTLLGMDYGALAGANEGVQQGFANQQSAVGMNAEMKSANRAANMGLVGDILKVGTSFIPKP